MNTEQKAKAYDEALERARKMLNMILDNELLGFPDQIREIFPQLRESKDERIRARLIEYFKGFLEGYEDCYKDGGCVKWEGLDVKSILAWLEKQKEQKHPNGCFTCDEYKKGYEEGRRNGFTAGYNKAMKEVEQKEQKPVVTLGETYHVDTLGTQQVIAGKMPQKPEEWNEWDEEMIGNCIDLLEHFPLPYGEVIGPWKDCIAWLKSLRPSWKPSEEQEEPEYYQHFDPDC